MKTEAWHRRQAIQIAAALPETTEDALMVLGAGTSIGRGIFGWASAARTALERDRGVVVSLSSATNGAANAPG